MKIPLFIRSPIEASEMNQRWLINADHYKLCLIEALKQSKGWLATHKRLIRTVKRASEQEEEIMNRQEISEIAIS